AAPPGGPGDGPPLIADVDGDGCPDVARWNGRVLLVRLAGSAAPPRRYRLGRPGDQLVLGDWNCDGAATPALYRPADGTLLAVDEFARRVGDRVEAARVERRAAGGRARVVRGANGCDTVVVEQRQPAGTGGP
ncbi:MAG: serine/threonine protein kinase, partial [Acidimicrobiales bacterium]|nr:serine/threonine protein kinase [Acidimicrobiales bacterium]